MTRNQHSCSRSTRFSFVSMWFWSWKPFFQRRFFRASLYWDRRVRNAAGDQQRNRRHGRWHSGNSFARTATLSNFNTYLIPHDYQQQNWHIITISVFPLQYDKGQGNVKFSIWVSFAEIYNEFIYDLLDKIPTLGKGTFLFGRVAS